MNRHISKIMSKENKLPNKSMLLQQNSLYNINVSYNLTYCTSKEIISSFNFFFLIKNKKSIFVDNKSTHYEQPCSQN